MGETELALWALINRLFYYVPTTREFVFRAVALSYEIVEEAIQELVAGNFEDFNRAEATRWVRRSKDLEPFPQAEL